jgi:hypothetical protein
MHQADPFGDEHVGAWFIYLPGSGIWINMGTTITFNDHGDAYSHFNIPPNVDQNEALCRAAAAAGYDTIQFLQHVDHVNYPCDTSHTAIPGFDYMGVEVVATQMVGTYACGAAGGAPPTIRSGWKASKSCSCDNGKDFLNCAGVPEMRLPARRVAVSAPGSRTLTNTTTM